MLGQHILNVQSHLHFTDIVTDSFCGNRGALVMLDLTNIALWLKMASILRDFIDLLAHSHAGLPSSSLFTFFSFDVIL